MHGDRALGFQFQNLEMFFSFAKRALDQNYDQSLRKVPSTILKKISMVMWVIQWTFLLRLS
jgi:hypothetical protein